MAPQTDSASLIRPALSGLRQPLSLDSQHNGLCRNIFHTFPAATAKAGRQAAAGRRGPETMEPLWDDVANYSFQRLQRSD